MIREDGILRDLPKDYTITDEELTNLNKTVLVVFEALVKSICSNTIVSSDYSKYRRELLTLPTDVVESNLDAIVKIIQTDKKQLLEVVHAYIPMRADLRIQAIKDNKLGAHDIFKVVKNIGARFNSLLSRESEAMINSHESFQNRLTDMCTGVSFSVLELKSTLNDENKIQIATNAVSQFEAEFEKLNDVELIQPFIKHERAVAGEKTVRALDMCVERIRMTDARKRGQAVKSLETAVTYGYKK